MKPLSTSDIANMPQRSPTACRRYMEFNYRIAGSHRNTKMAQIGTGKEAQNLSGKSCCGITVVGSKKTHSQ
jgi:hypothetical protein